MKKIICTMLAVAALLICLAAGYLAGISHVIYGQELYIVEMPEMGSNYFEVYASLDGNINVYLGCIC